MAGGGKSKLKTRFKKEDEQNRNQNEPLLSSSSPRFVEEPLPLDPMIETQVHSPEGIENIPIILPTESWKADLINFIKSELNYSQPQEVQEEGLDAVVVEENDYRTERILNLLKVPLKLEIFCWFGYLICLDSFLHLFTILPLKIMIILFKQSQYYIRHLFYRRQGGPLPNLSRQQKSDLINGLLIVCACFLLQNVDASRLYHSIRGQAIIKLYVIFNALEICDKLASAFGHDIMDSLHSYSPQMRTHFKRWMRFLLALAYIYGHTLVLFYQVMSLNVAINSYNNALLTLLISNQFVEIKGSVFKRFEKGNLFQLSCADSVERFQLSVFLLIVTIRNCLEIFGSGAVGDLSNAIMYYSMSFRDGVISLYNLDYSQATSISFSSIFSAAMGSNELKLAQIVIGPYVMVLGTEMIVDWIKHAFIVKFNGLKPAVYDRFMESICRDILGIKYSSLLEKDKQNTANDEVAPEIKHDRSPIVSKRIGFISIPIACLVIRVGYQLLQTIGIMPETLIGGPRWTNEDQTGTNSVSDGPVEDESIGSWRLPLKLATWIKSRRNSFEKAGLSSGFSFPALWILVFFLLVVFKFALGIVLLYISRGYLVSRKADRERKGGEQDPKQLDEILNIHTPHHMLPLHVIKNSRDVIRGNSNLELDEIDRFSMKSPPFIKMDSFAVINIKRKATYVRLTTAKKIGFFGALALLFNAATGPGLPFTPANFQTPGYVITILSFLIFAFISGFSILFIVEAMQAIPGNKHFQGDVEYATLINFYFGHWAHIAGQMLLYGALQSNAVQGIVLSSQSIDNMFIDIFGKTCGLALSGPYTGWICVARQSVDYPSPFGNNWMLFSLGMLVVFMLALPLGLTNLDDNMWVQYLAFVISIIMTLQWMSTSFVVGFDTSRLVSAAPFGVVYGQVIGTVLLNLAITTIIPSWINIKRKDVNVQQSVWASILCVTGFYVISGLVLAGGYDNISSNVMQTLLMAGKPKILTKFMVYIFSFVMLIPSIPVNLIISKDNLFQNDIMSEKLAVFVSFVLPLLVVIPFQTGNSLGLFQSWTSTIFVSPSNFIIPVIIYFKCVEFRKKYNTDHELTGKQLSILKRIHSKSSSLVSLLGQKKLKLDNRLQAQRESVTINPASNISTEQDAIVVEAAPLPSITAPSNPHTESSRDNVDEDTPCPIPTETLSTELGSLIQENVPDPDKEDEEEGRLMPLSSQNNFVSRLVTTLGRSKAPRNLSKVEIHYGENIEINVIPSEKKTNNSPSSSLKESIPAPRTETEQAAAARASETTLDAHPVGTLSPGGNDMIEVVRPKTPSEHSLLGIPSMDFAAPKRDSWEEGGSSMNRSAGRLDRLKTLPTHPNFKSPAFRSVPKWMPIRGYHMAWIVLVVTSTVTFGNLILLFLPAKST